MNNKLSFKEKFETTNFLKPIGFFILAELIVIILIAVNGDYGDIIESFLPIFFIILVLIFILRKCTGLKESASQLKNKNMLKELGILMILISFAESFLSVIFSFIVAGGYLPSSFTESNLVFGDYVIVDLIAAIILAPLAEELFFRGFLLNRLNYRLSNRKYGLLISIIITSLIFALAHGTSVCVYIIPSAFLFAMVYLKYNNLFASMTLHALFNILAYGLGLLSFYSIFDIDAFFTGTGWGIFFLITGAIAIYFIVKYIVGVYKEIK